MMLPISIKASGLVTAVGFNASASLAAMRAGISGVKKANLWDAESGEYISAGKVDLPQWWEGLGKLTELVAPAIQECLLAAQEIPPEEIPILLCVAALDRPFRMNGLDDQLLEDIEFKLGVKLHPASQVIARGRISGVVALQEASKLLTQKEVRTCIVAGVDSFLQQSVVEAYMAQRRIMTPSNSNGFFPGEAGSAVLISKNEFGCQGQLDILGIGFAKEKSIIASDDPLQGLGLTTAVSQALNNAKIQMGDIDYRITDLNGEHYKFKEAVFPIARLLKDRKEDGVDLWHPNEFLGDIGAAIGPCALAFAVHAGQKKYAPNGCVLFHFSNDNDERAAVVARFNTGAKG